MLVSAFLQDGQIRVFSVAEDVDSSSLKFKVMSDFRLYVCCVVGVEAGQTGCCLDGLLVV